MLCLLSPFHLLWDDILGRYGGTKLQYIVTKIYFQIFHFKFSGPWDAQGVQVLVKQDLWQVSRPCLAFRVLKLWIWIIKNYHTKITSHRRDENYFGCIYRCHWCIWACSPKGSFHINLYRFKFGEINFFVKSQSAVLISCHLTSFNIYHCRLPKTVRDFLIVVVGAFEHAVPKVLSTSIQIGLQVSVHNQLNCKRPLSDQDVVVGNNTSKCPFHLLDNESCIQSFPRVWSKFEIITS